MMAARAGGVAVGYPMLLQMDPYSLSRKNSMIRTLLHGSWWETDSRLWQESVFYTLCGAYSLLAAVTLVRLILSLAYIFCSWIPFICTMNVG
jgi:hypothetical protein